MPFENQGNDRMENYDRLDRRVILSNSRLCVLLFFFSKKLQRIGKFKEKETRREGGIGCHDAKINNE